MWEVRHQTGKGCCIQKSFERHHIRCQHKNVHTSNEEYRIVPNKHEEKHTTSEGRENDCDFPIVIGEFTALISNVELMVTRSMMIATYKENANTEMIKVKE